MVVGASARRRAAVTDAGAGREIEPEVGVAEEEHAWHLNECTGNARGVQAATG